MFIYSPGIHLLYPIDYTVRLATVRSLHRVYFCCFCCADHGITEVETATNADECDETADKSFSVSPPRGSSEFN